jgi:cell wall-associated NlpC family hydrolase
MSGLRARVVAEALSWRGTPWHHMARLKGAQGGVDCAQFLIGAFQACGIVPAMEVGYYPPDWHLHRDEPRFLAILRQHAEPVESALPGDVAMFKFGRHAAHGAIVIKWPEIVHAWIDERMVIGSDVARTPRLAERFEGFWRLNVLAGEA